MDFRTEKLPERLSIDQHVDRLLKSANFRQAPRQQRLLRYLVDAAIAADARRLKEYTLGVEVFDRPVDFDPTESALVRVEVGRLRSKLMAYYSEEGSAESLRLALPKGSYAIRFDALPHRQPAATPRENDPAERERPSIAVLPLHYLSGPEGLAWYADGITEDLITDLSKISGLLVCSRHSSFACRGATEDTRVLAQRLGVRYLLAGSVRVSESLIRVTVQLTDALYNSQVWADRLDASPADVLRLQAGISERVVGVLQPHLSPVDVVRIGHEETASVEAHALVVQGMGDLWKYTPEGNIAARAKFGAAIAIDADYASAHAWLARTLMADYVFRFNNADQPELNAARVHARHAIAADSLLSAGHAVRCWAELWARDESASLQAGERAVHLDPNNGDARLFYSVALSAAVRPNDAQCQIETALRLCPQPSAFYLWAYGLSMQLQNRLVEAESAYLQSIALKPEFIPSHAFLAFACLTQGRKIDAMAAADRYRSIFKTDVVPLRRIFFNDYQHGALYSSLVRLGLRVLEPY